MIEQQTRRKCVEIALQSSERSAPRVIEDMRGSFRASKHSMAVAGDIGRRKWWAGGEEGG